MPSSPPPTAAHPVARVSKLDVRVGASDCTFDRLCELIYQFGHSPVGSFIHMFSLIHSSISFSYSMHAAVSASILHGSAGFAGCEGYRGGRGYSRRLCRFGTSAKLNTSSGPGCEVDVGFFHEFEHGRLGDWRKGRAKARGGWRRGAPSSTQAESESQSQRCT